MTLESIVFEAHGDGRGQETPEAPAFFADLNLDRIVDAITADWKSYDLKPFYYTRLDDLDAIAYRQQIMQDLENKILMEAVKSFSKQMRAMRDRLERAKNMYFKLAVDRVFLGAVEIYCAAIGGLSRDLCALDVTSRGLRAFREYLTEYVGSAGFRNLVTEVEEVTSNQHQILLAYQGQRRHPSSEKQIPRNC
jgi:DNA mismatch repair protein MutS